jgi:hypothetical protein
VHPRLAHPQLPVKAAVVLVAPSHQALVGAFYSHEGYTRRTLSGLAPLVLAIEQAPSEFFQQAEA